MMDDLQIVGMTMPRQPRSRARAAKKKHKAFKADWAKFPQQWAKALRRSKSTAAAYELAISILFKALECEYTGQEIILSSDMTGMPRTTRRKAAKHLVKLGLIKLYRQSKNQAHRVSLYY
jgi:hypothetical protein